MRHHEGLKPESDLAILRQHPDKGEGGNKEVAVGTGISAQPRGHEDRHQRWHRLARAERDAQYGDRQAQGLSPRPAAQARAVPRSTLPAWRASQERRAACPVVVTLFHRVPGLAFLHRLVLALHLVGVEVGACGIRLGCLVLKLPGLTRFVGAA